MAKKKRNKFGRMWGTQTTLGRKYGLSAIKVGKLLEEAGWKDSTARGATERALREGLAVSTPLKDGTPFFMWNVRAFGGIVNLPPLDKISILVNDVRSTLRAAQRLMDSGQDKAGILLAEAAYNNIPDDLVAEVRARVEALGG